MEPVSGYIPVNGIDEFVMEFAREGKPVLLYLHGGPGESMIPFAGKFSREMGFATVIWYDQRGTGRTYLKNRSPEEEISVENLLEDLRQTIAWIREKYGVEKVFLLGHSWGSYLGSVYTQRHPEDIEAYIGVGQVTDLPAQEKAGFEHLKTLMTDPDEEDRKALEIIRGYPDSMEPSNPYPVLLQERMLARKYGLLYPQETVMDLIAQSGTCEAQDLEAMAYLEQNRHLMEHLFSHTLNDQTTYAVPIYYLLGENDWQVASSVAEEYFQTISAPVKELVMIEGASHIPALDNPDVFYGALRRIMEG